MVFNLSRVAYAVLDHDKQTGVNAAAIGRGRYAVKDFFFLFLILFHLKTPNFCVGFPFASGAYLLLIKLNIYHQSYARSLQLGKAKCFFK